MIMSCAARGVKKVGQHCPRPKVSIGSNNLHFRNTKHDFLAKITKLTKYLLIVSVMINAKMSNVANNAFSNELAKMRHFVNREFRLVS